MEGGGFIKPCFFLGFGLLPLLPPFPQGGGGIWVPSSACLVVSLQSVAQEGSVAVARLCLARATLRADLGFSTVGGGAAKGLPLPGSWETCCPSGVVEVLQQCNSSE